MTQAERTTELLKAQTTREFIAKAVSTQNRSLRQLSQRAAFGSTGFLSMLRSGRRKLTPAVAQRLSNALSLTPRARSYLLLLAKDEMPCSLAERARIREKILTVQSRVTEKTVSLHQHQAFRSWLAIAIWVMAGLARFQEDPEWISSQLIQKTTLEDIKTNLRLLEKLGLLVRDEQGRLKRVNPAMTSEDESPNIALQAWHFQMLGLAQKALTLPVSQREFDGLTIAIPHSELPKVKDKIKALRTELNETLSRFNDAEQVYHLEISLFPLTHFSQTKESQS